MLGRSSAVAAPDRGVCPALGGAPAVDLLPFLILRRPDIPFIPMGYPVARNRVPCNFLRANAMASRHFARPATIDNTPLVISSPVVPSHVFFRICEAREPRSAMVESHGAYRPLRNAAAPYSACLVCSSIAAVGAPGFMR